MSTEKERDEYKAEVEAAWQAAGGGIGLTSLSERIRDMREARDAARARARIYETNLGYVLVERDALKAQVERTEELLESARGISDQRAAELLTLRRRFDTKVGERDRLREALRGTRERVEPDGDCWCAYKPGCEYHPQPEHDPICLGAREALKESEAPNVLAVLVNDTRKPT